MPTVLQVNADYSSYIAETTRAQAKQQNLQDATASTIVTFKKLDKGMVQATATTKGLTAAGDSYVQTLKLKSTQLAIAKSQINKAIAGEVKLKGVTQELTIATESLAQAQARAEKEFRDLSNEADRLTAKERANRQEVARLTRQTIAARKAQDKHADSMRRTAVASKSLNVHLDRTLNTFARLLSLRIAAGFFFAIERQMRETIQTATELSRRIGEVQTIIRPDEQTLIGYERLNESIKDFSRAYNFELLDTVEAFYDNLSNQIADNTKDLVQFTNTAAVLAKATVSSLEDSSNALTAVINAFGLNINQASNIAGAFFNTVDLGRVRLSELANTMGTVAVPAEQLGLTYQELFGAIATISRRGIDAARTQTLMRNIILKLLKPTGKMTEILDDWGVNSGRAAIATFGLVGVFQKLEEITRGGGGPEEIAQAFSRIRAIVGSQALIGSIDEFASDVKSMVDDVERLNVAFEIVQKNVGETFSRELNQIRIDLTEAFGQNAIDALVSYHNEWFDLSDTLRNIAPLLAAVGVAAITAIAAPLALAGFGVATALTPWLVGIGAITTATAGYFLLWEDGFEKIARDARITAQKIETEFIQANQTITDTFIQDLIAATRPQLQAIAAENALLTKQEALNEFILETLFAEQKERVKLLELQISAQKSVVTLNSETVKTLFLTKEKLRLQKEHIKSLEDEKKLVQESFLAAEKSIARARFDRSLRNVPETQQQFRQASFASRLTKEGQELIAIGEIAAGVSLLEEARTILGALDQTLFEETGRTSNRFTTQLIAVEDVLFNSLTKRGEIVNINLERQRTELELTEQIINKKKEDFERAKEQLAFTKKILDAIKDNRDNELFTIEKINTRSSNLIGILDSVLGKQSAITQTLRDQLNIQIAQENLTTSRESVEKTLTDEKRKRQEISDIGTANAAIETQIINNLSNVITLLRDTNIRPRGIFSEAPGAPSPESVRNEQAIKEAIQEIIQITPGNITSENLAEVRSAIFELRKTFEETGINTVALDELRNVFATAINLFEHNTILATTADATLITLQDDLKERQRNVHAFTEAAELSVKASKAVEDIAITTVTVLDNALIAHAEALKNVPAALEQAVIDKGTFKFEFIGAQVFLPKASITFGNADITEAVDFKASGGLIHGPSGIDRVPAMLTAGEFVINKVATRTNLALLRSINAGHGPVTHVAGRQYYAHGGEVNTINNKNSITIQSSGNEAIDARTFINKLNTEQSRGRGRPTRNY